MQPETNLPPRQNALWPGASASPLANWRFEHEYYEAVREWTWDHIECNDEPVIVVVFGATGTGKTTLREQVQLEIAKSRAIELAANPGTVPYVYGETVFNPRVGVDWAGLLRKWLESGGDMLVDKKVTGDGKHRASLPALQLAVTSMLLHRSPSIASVDEASVLLGKVSNSSTDTLKTNVNYIKGLCNMSRTHLGLFGDYDLAKLAQISGQLDRRCYFGHLPPYPDATEDFRKALTAFEQRFSQFGVEAELLVNGDLLLNGCVGCVGILRRWLMEAHIKTRHKHARITEEVLLQTHFPAAQIKKWQAEIAEGNSRVAWMKDIAPGAVYDPRD
jgi:hypothetical protein